MGLNDFNKIKSNSENVKEDMENDKLIDDIDFQNIACFMSNLDDLINRVNESYVAYVNAKLEYDLKKDKYQVTINWNEENALRESNGLPKVTTQPQRESVINLKLKNLQVTMKECEVKYKFYNKIFDFISKNYGLLYKSVFDVPKADISEFYGDKD